MAINDHKLDHWFGKIPYDKLTADQKTRLERVRASCKLAAETILTNTDACADQSSAIRDVRNAMKTAADLILRGKS